MKHLYMVLEKNKIQTLLEIHFENIFIQFLDLFRPTSIDSSSYFLNIEIYLQKFNGV